MRFLFESAILTACLCYDYMLYNLIYNVCMFRRYKAWLKDALHHRSQYTTLCWTSAIALLINGLILIIIYLSTGETWYEI